MTDSSRFVPDLIRFEGSVPHMYRDTLGYVTVGVGNLVHDGLHAASLPFLTDGDRRATAKEIGDDFLRVIALAKGMAASQYRAPRPPHVSLSQESIDELLRARLDLEFLPGIHRLLPDFDSYPAPAQSALVDIAFNCGVSGLSTFHHLLDACRNRQWAAAAELCHRKTSRAERNEWTRAKFLEASNG
jgi:GH24 family phage-related lysozyme (muramidase)